MSIIEVSASAQDRIKALLDRDGKLATHGLRLKVIGGGCSGLQYQLGFDDRIGDADNEFHAGAVKIIVDDKSAAYLAGSGGFFDLREWSDADWQRARDMIKARNEQDRAQR